ncbi:MAG: hypothetical protein KDB14_04965 [Planctomycetales bacterium]|nr:hypothetical protein [Planctomycetales bacterium]
MISERLAPVAEHYGVAPPRGAWGPRASMYLNVHGVEVRVRVVQFNVYSGDLYRVTALLPKSLGEIVVRPATPFDAAWKWLGWGFKTGQPSFDASFVVQGSGARRNPALFDLEVQSALLALNGILGQLRINERTFDLTSRRNVQRLVSQAIILIETLTGNGESAVSFIDSPSDGWQPSQIADVRIDEEAACPVCGDLLSGSQHIVYCEKCDTPHHGDCWKYVRGCAVFACGCRRSNRTSSRRSMLARLLHRN